MLRSGLLVAVLATLAGCSSTGSYPGMTGAYLWTGHCYVYDHARTGGSWCSGNMWR